MRLVTVECGNRVVTPRLAARTTHTHTQRTASSARCSPNRYLHHSRVQYTARVGDIVHTHATSHDLSRRSPPMYQNLNPGQDTCEHVTCRVLVHTNLNQNLNPGQDTREQTTKRTHERRHEGTHEGAHQHRPTNQPATHATNDPPRHSLTRSAPELVGRQDPRLRELH